MSREDYYNNLKAERGRGPRRGERHEEAGWKAHGHHEHDQHEHGHREHDQHDHDQHEHGWGRGPFAGRRGPLHPPFFPWAFFFGHWGGHRGPFGRGFGRGFGPGFEHEFERGFERGFGRGFGRGRGGPGFGPEREEWGFRGGPGPRRGWGRRGPGREFGPEAEEWGAHRGRGPRWDHRHGGRDHAPHGPSEQEWRDHQIAHLEHVQERLERHLAEIKGALEHLKARRENPTPPQDAPPSGEDAATTRI